MAIRDRDYMKQPASPSEFPEAEEESESSKPAPFDLFAGLPVEQLSTTAPVTSAATVRPMEKKNEEPSQKPNFWMLAVIALILAIVIGAVLLS